MKSESTLLVSIFILTGLVTGCGPEQDVGSADDSALPIVMDEMPPNVEDDIDSERGPHGGALIELGKGEYFVEVIQTDTSAVFHLLGANALDPVAVESGTLTVSLKHRGNVASFEVPPKSTSNEPGGEESRFVSNDAEMVRWISLHAAGVVVVNIDGRSYTGEFAHAYGDP